MAGPVTSSASKSEEAGAGSLSQGTSIRIEWGPIIGGALSAAALAFLLQTFAIAIGLSASSTAPTWRDASFALVLLSGLYLLLVAIAAYGLGGYLAGRLRSRSIAATHKEIEFRDGVHGLLAWALATLIGACIAIASVQSLTRLAAPSAGSAGPSAAVAGENIIAFDLDRLFRGDRQPEANINYARSEAARILLTASSHAGMQQDDRAYLVRLVAARTGLAAPDADRRVNEVIERAKENISRARRSAIILAFMTGAAALVGAAVSWFAAGAGGAHRDERSQPHPLLNWTAVTPDQPRWRWRG